MTAKTALIDRQLAWAAQTGYAADSRAYLSAVDTNFSSPYRRDARVAFERGSGSELLDTPTRPAKLKALHSSSALAVNVFDYWTTVDSSPLARALGIHDPITAISFEAQYPTGLAGTPPNLDVVLTLQSGTCFAIESKFSEWLARKPAGKLAFKEKYFAGGVELWADKKLSECQTLAGPMQAGAVEFEYLDAPQLLKHALGLATQLGAHFSLHYFYYDWPGEESQQHQVEIRAFASQIDAGLAFTASSYQAYRVAGCSERRACKVFGLFAPAVFWCRQLVES